MEGIKAAGYVPGKDIYLGMDTASSEFYDEETHKYVLKRSGQGSKTSEEMINWFAEMVEKYPIITLEDGLAEGDWDGWKKLTDKLGNKIQIVGDDLFVTNPAILKEGIEKGIANSVLIKLNQIGTLTETMDCIRLAQTNNYTCMGIKQVSLDHEYVLFASTIQSTSWRVAIFTNNEAMSKALISFITVLSVLSLVIIGVFSIIMILVANSITSPIRELQYKMQKIESLNYVVNSEKEISGSKEVQDLSRNFNLMMERIKELTEKVIDEQEEQRKSELKALQNQINPHFLYNTFDSVIYMIDKGENDKAEEMIVALSKFFRISVSKGHNIIPLEKEIEHGNSKNEISDYKANLKAEGIYFTSKKNETRSKRDTIIEKARANTYDAYIQKYDYQTLVHGKRDKKSERCCSLCNS